MGHRACLDGLGEDRISSPCCDLNSRPSSMWLVTILSMLLVIKATQH